MVQADIKRVTLPVFNVLMVGGIFCERAEQEVACFKEAIIISGLLYTGKPGEVLGKGTWVPPSRAMLKVISNSK